MQLPAEYTPDQKICDSFNSSLDPMRCLAPSGCGRIDSVCGIFPWVETLFQSRLGGTNGRNHVVVVE